MILAFWVGEPDKGKAQGSITTCGGTNAQGNQLEPDGR